MRDIHDSSWDEADECTKHTTVLYYFNLVCHVIWKVEESHSNWLISW